ncbi:hypothetical protein ACS0TY_033125 [Phlomoides rotata]
MYAGILFIILSIIVACCKILHLRRENKLVPTNWPILGMMPGLLVNFGRVHDFVTDIMGQSGGTFLFQGPWFTNMEMLITCDPANIHYVLTKNFPNFPKGPDFKKMFDVLGDGIFIAESESWENQRRAAKSLINQPSFQEFVAMTSWNKVETGLFPILDLSSELGTQVDMQDLCKRFAFDCSCIEVLGYDPGSLCHDLPHLPFEKAFEDAEEAILYRHILPERCWKLQNLLNVGKERNMKRAKEIVDRFLRYCISLKRENFNITKGENDFDILTRYMRAVLEKDQVSDVPEEIWRDTMLNLIFAGKDTISAALTWFFWLLATNPAEEEKIRHEMSANLGGQNWKYSNMEELKKLVYLQGALCESLRLFPPVPFQHKAPVEHDVLPSGHRISPNTKTVLSFYSMGRMESIWGKDCLEFKPGRWISEVGRIKVEPSFKFTAFNAGPRSCLGKDMSFIQMKIVAAAVISRFRITVVEAHPISPRTSVILHMKQGFKVKVSKFSHV